MKKAADWLEHQVSPWLRVIVPMLLTLIVFMQTQTNSRIDTLRNEMTELHKKVGSQGERISANETAIQYITGP